MRGPIDYIIVGFEGNNFDGSVLKALGEAIDKGIIALVALSFLMKDNEGNLTKLELSEFTDDVIVEFRDKYVDSSNDLVTDDDISEVSELLENNTAAGLLVIEQLWAKPLKEALLNANGELVAEGRIHPEAAQEINQREV